MPKRTSDAELQTIWQLVNQYGDGASIETLQRKTNLPRRTLQRRLAKLVKERRIRTRGKGRSLRYYGNNLDVLQHKITKEIEIYIPISAESDDIKEYVRQLPNLRIPTSYNRAFLESYKPNKTYYLPESIRHHLNDIGDVHSGQQPAGTYIRLILKRLLIDLSWNSSRLEGNTYSLLETERLIEYGEIAEGKPSSDAQMILNHKSAIEFLTNNANEIGFNRFTILNLHALLSDNLLPNPAACGQLRKIPVGVSHTVYHPLEVPQTIEEIFQKILDITALIKDPFEQAFFIMVHIPYLQAFDDVNKRVSRLAANIPLIKNNLCPLSFIDVPLQALIDGIIGIYELNKVELLRDVFIWAYERSADRYAALRNSIREPDLFRLKYRNQIITIIKEIIKSKLNQKLAIAFINKWSKDNIHADDRNHFIEVIEDEISALHIGNIARYSITINEFNDWRANWK